MTGAAIIEEMKWKQVVDLASRLKTIDQLATLEAKAVELQQQLDETRRLNVVNAVERMILRKQIPESVKEDVITRAIADESFLNDLTKIYPPPPKPAGYCPF